MPCRAVRTQDFLRQVSGLYSSIVTFGLCVCVSVCWYVYIYIVSMCCYVYEGLYLCIRMYIRFLCIYTCICR